jgi:hypothetical protein
VQLSPFSHYFIHLRSKYSPQHPVLEHPHLSSSLNVRDQVSHPYKTTGRIMVLLEEATKFPKWQKNFRTVEKAWSTRNFIQYAWQDTKSAEVTSTSVSIGIQFINFICKEKCLQLPLNYFQNRERVSKEKALA